MAFLVRNSTPLSFTVNPLTIMEKAAVPAVQTGAKIKEESDKAKVVRNQKAEGMGTTLAGDKGKEQVVKGEQIEDKGEKAGEQVAGEFVKKGLVGFQKIQELSEGGSASPQPQAGQTPQVGQMPQAGQMSQVGQMPQAGQMTQAGQMPQVGQMPQAGQMTQAGQMPQFGQMPQAAPSPPMV